MHPGQLRKRVTILENQPIKGAFRGEKPNYVPIATVWGGFAPQVPGSGEAEHAEQQVNVSTMLVTLRYAGSIPLTTRHQLQMNGRKFAIANIVNVDERNRQWTVVVKEQP